MKKIFSLLSLIFAMSMMSLQCWATASVSFGTETLTAGQTLTSSDSHIESGSISYSSDGTTITLDNLTEASGSFYGLQITDCSVRIILVGDNTIGYTTFESTGSSYTHSIESTDGTGSLTISTTASQALYGQRASLTIKNCSVDVRGGGSWGFYGWSNGAGTGFNLTIQNATVKAQATSGSIAGRIDGLTLIGCSFTAPSGAYYDSTNHFVTTGGTNPTAEQVVIQPSVTLNANGFATFSNLTEVAVPSTVEAYTATVDVAAPSITWTKIAPEAGGTTIIPAQEGVLIKGTANATAVLAASSTSKAKSSTNQLKPNLTAMTNSANSHIYVLSGSDIMLLAETGTLAANKAYFQLTQDVTTSGGAVKGFTYTWDEGDETAISAVPGSDILTTGATYNLAGQRVNANHKGLVIKNGKKYFVK